MSPQPRFTVVIPAYNRANVISRAVSSVLAQSEASFELLVIDDGSTDGTGDVVTALDPRVRVVRTGHHGVAAARNLGAAASSGEIVTFLDSDDEARVNWLEDFGALLVEEDDQIACCAVERRVGATVRDVLRPRPLGPVFADATGLFLAGSFAIRTGLWEGTGGYASLAMGENTELALRATWRCRDVGGHVLHTDHPNLVWHSDGPKPYPPADVLGAATFVLERHSEVLKEDPTFEADYLTMAGTSSIRLGQIASGRRFLARAYIRDRSARRLSRLLAASLPLGPSAVWSRDHSPPP